MEPQSPHWLLSHCCCCSSPSICLVSLCSLCLSHRLLRSSSSSIISAFFTFYFYFCYCCLLHSLLSVLVKLLWSSALLTRSICADWSLLVQPRRRFFNNFYLLLLFIIVLCVLIRGGRKRAATQEVLTCHFFVKKCGDFRTDLLLQSFFLSFLPLFLLIATLGMLNLDWWMFLNCASQTRSATTASECFPSSFLLVFISFRSSLPLLVLLPLVLFSFL